MRRDEFDLNDILEAVDHVAAFLVGVEYDDFEASEMVRSAVVQKLAIVGEAAGRVSEEFKSRHPEVPWRQLAAFRNILVHAYFGIDWAEVWRAAKNRCPVLRDQVAGIMESEFGGPGQHTSSC